MSTSTTPRKGISGTGGRAPSKDHAHLIIPEGGENRAALDVIVGCLLYGLR